MLARPLTPRRRLMASARASSRAAGAVCAITPSFAVLIAMRAVQGAFIPTLTTCSAAWLSRALPPQALNVAMGTDVSATVAGGSWRPSARRAGCIRSAALAPRVRGAVGTALLAVTLLIVAPRLNDTPRARRLRGAPASLRLASAVRKCSRNRGVRRLRRLFHGLQLLSVLPSRTPWSLSTANDHRRCTWSTSQAFMGPFAGRLGNRFGNGVVMIAGALLLAVALLATLRRGDPGRCWRACRASRRVLRDSCVGRRRTEPQPDGRTRKGERALYVFYYLGGAAGIALGGELYARLGLGRRRRRVARDVAVAARRRDYFLPPCCSRFVTSEGLP